MYYKLFLEILKQTLQFILATLSLSPMNHITIYGKYSTLQYGTYTICHDMTMMC